MKSLIFLHFFGFLAMIAAQNRNACTTYNGEYLGGGVLADHFHMYGNWNGIRDGNGHVKIQPRTRYNLNEGRSEGERWLQIARAIAHLDNKVKKPPNYAE